MTSVGPTWGSNSIIITVERVASAITGKGRKGVVGFYARHFLPSNGGAYRLSVAALPSPPAPKGGQLTITAWLTVECPGNHRTRLAGLLRVRRLDHCTKRHPVKINRSEDKILTNWPNRF